MAAIETALRLDPLSIMARTFYVRGLIVRDRLDEAGYELEKLAVIAPKNYLEVRSELTSRGGQWAKAVLTSLDALQAGAGTRGDLGMQFAFIGLEKEALAIEDMPRSDVLSIIGRPADSIAVAEKWLAKLPGDTFLEHRLGQAYAGAGDYARARPILERMWQLSGGLVTTNGLFLYDNAVALIVMRREAGEEAGNGKLLAAIKDNVTRFREAGISGWDWNDADYEEGLATYLTGEHEQGLALMARAVAERGFFILQKEAYLQILYDDPDFAPIRASQETRQIRERNKVLAIVCTDNPYEAVWQPEEGTCERFAAARGE
jgi:tetratricopeptide (TPR) repeat protein